MVPPAASLRSIVSLDNLCQSRNGALTQDLLTPDVDLRRRDRELTEIAKSIASLAELFKDLSALVIDQGTLLDSIEYNIEQTAVQMSEAVLELNVTTRCAFSSFFFFFVRQSSTIVGCC